MSNFNSNTICLLRPSNGQGQVILFQQVVFMARSNNFTLNSDLYVICVYIFTEPLKTISKRTSII